MKSIIKSKNVINEKMKIKSMKHITKNMPLKNLEDGKYFYVSLSQHIGQVSKELVNVGDEVRQYEKIGEIQGFVSSFIHSPISGKVVNIFNNYLPNGNIAKIIKIENNYKYEKIEIKTRTLEEVLMLENEKILEIIKESRIVGEGGAQFPTHVKYAIGDKKVETLILNGAECEPYLTSDYTLINTYTEEFLKGIKIIDKLLNPNEIVIGIEEENEELAPKMIKFIEKLEMDKVKIQILPTSYPQGSELQLIKTVTGKELRKGVLPIDFGVVVSNVATVKSIYDAVVDGKPLIERVVTISGEKVEKIGNYLVKIGTPLKYIIEQLNPKKESKIIFGGPMMGSEVELEKNIIEKIQNRNYIVENEELTKENVATIKGTSGILFLSTKIDDVERKNCISCNACVDVCPMGLMPLYFAKNYEKGNIKKQLKLNIDSCLECGACEYACPSRVPLIASIKESKGEIAKMRQRGEVK